MPIVAHGIDFVENERIAAMIDRHGGHFLDRVYTIREQEYCDSSRKGRVEHYAVRFAAKEAVLKAIGTGWRSGIAWTDVEVLREASGQPNVRVIGRAREAADQRGITHWHLSLTHTRSHAMASAIAESLR